jgi:hypothetical protein
MAGGIIMKIFTKESTEERARPAPGRRSESDAAKSGDHHNLSGTSASAQASLLKGMGFNGHPVAQRSLIQLQHHLGNQSVSRAVKTAGKNEAEMMQTKMFGDPIQRQAEEEPEEEAVQTKPATGEIQRQPQEEEKETE